MKRFVEGENRSRSTSFIQRLDDYVGEDNPVPVVDIFVAELYFGSFGFSWVGPLATGRPSYYPSALLKL
jgi:hypothetical protein